MSAEIWDVVTGRMQPLRNLVVAEGGVAVRIRLDPRQSFFVVFDRTERALVKNDGSKPDEFEVFETVLTLDGPWTVAFDPAWGGPEQVVFDQLVDWTKRPEEGIRHYSGIAVYSRTFDVPRSAAAESKDRPLYLNLGVVKHLARVKLNGRDLGAVWTAPQRVRIGDAVQPRDNRLEVEVANLWINRMIGDESEPWDGVEDGKWPAWVLERLPRPTRRLAFATHRFYKKDDPLVESGLIGPVRLMR
ncbi:MAG: glycosylhydrolase-like jelly roll fold domain-containing protein [Candidatus Aminicenantales bacterium]